MESNQTTQGGESGKRANDPGRTRPQDDIEKGPEDEKKSTGNLSEDNPELGESGGGENPSKR